MFGFRSPFGRREGVPRKDAAMAALGVDVKGSKGFKGDRGSKGSEDEIRLSAAEQLDAERAEHIEEPWSMNDLYEWAESFAQTRPWVRNRFIVTKNGIRFLDDFLDLSYARTDHLPPNLTVRFLKVGQHLTSLPSGLHVQDALDLRDTRIDVIPDDAQINKVVISNSQGSLLDSVRKHGITNIEVRD